MGETEQVKRKRAALRHERGVRQESEVHHHGKNASRNEAEGGCVHAQPLRAERHGWPLQGHPPQSHAPPEAERHLRCRAFLRSTHRCYWLLLLRLQRKRKAAPQVLKLKTLFFRCITVGTALS